MKNISFPIYTKHLVLKESSLQELQKLERCYEEFCNIMEPINGVPWDSGDVKKQLEEGDLPPGGVKERYQHICLYDKNTAALIGFMELYNGYPEENIYYIGMLYISRECQRKGLGKEAVESIYNLLLKGNFHSLRVSVDLKNWPALYFWFSLKFSKIIKLTGDKTLTPTHFMKMELERAVFK